MTQYRVIRRSQEYLSNWDEIYPVLKEYAAKLETTILVANLHCEGFEPRDRSGRLYINFYSSAEDDPDYTTIHRAYGVELSIISQEDAVESVSGGVDIFDEEGVLVAQVFGRTLYVLFNLPMGPNAGMLMRRIMEDYAIYMQAGTPEEWAEIRRQRRDELVAGSKPRFIKMVEKQSSTAVDSRLTALSDLEKDIAYYQQQIQKLVRQRRQLIAQMAAENKPSAADEAETMFEQLQALSPTETVIVTDTYIQVDVGQINIQHMGQTYDIGEFDVFIYPDVDDDDDYVARCVNRTRVVQGKHGWGHYHPHVSDDGEPCFGNVSDLIPKLIGEGQYGIAIGVIIKYLKSYNPGDTLCDIGAFPVVG